MSRWRETKGYHDRINVLVDVVKDACLQIRKEMDKMALEDSAQTTTIRNPALERKGKTMDQQTTGVFK